MKNPNETLEVRRGRQFHFDDMQCFFITNHFDKPAAEIVFEVNDRCNQENLFAQLETDMRARSTPVNTQTSTWVSMVMA
jgi:hypothetical protein